MSFEKRSNSAMEGNGSNSEMQATTQQSSAQILCRTGCGFYGGSDGLCSKCRKDSMLRDQGSTPAPSAASMRSAAVAAIQSASSSVSVSQSDSEAKMGELASIETGLPTVPTIDKDTSAIAESNDAKCDVASAAASCVATATTDDDKATPALDKPKKNRCLTCKKKLGLTGFECRCGGLYCGTHRYSDTHQCTFNYKELAQQEIRKNNPVVVGNKIQKI